MRPGENDRYGNHGRRGNATAPTLPVFFPLLVLPPGVCGDLGSSQNAPPFLCPPQPPSQPPANIAAAATASPSPAAL